MRLGMFEKQLSLCLSTKVDTNKTSSTIEEPVSSPVPPSALKAIVRKG